MKKVKETLPRELVKKYLKDKWQNKALGEKEDGYYLDHIHDVGNEVIEFWKKS